MHNRPDSPLSTVTLATYKSAGHPVCPHLQHRLSPPRFPQEGWDGPRRQAHRCPAWNPVRTPPCMGDSPCTLPGREHRLATPLSANSQKARPVRTTWLPSRSVPQAPNTRPTHMSPFCVA